MKRRWENFTITDAVGRRGFCIDEGCFSSVKPGQYGEEVFGTTIVGTESGGTAYDPIDGADEVPEAGQEDFEQGTLDFLMDTDSSTSNGITDPTYDSFYNNNYSAPKPINGVYDPINKLF